MENIQLTEVFQNTLDPNRRQQAEELLSQIQRINGFAPCLMEMVLLNEVDIQIRQAGAIYLKNFILASWQVKEPEDNKTRPFSIHEQDRAIIRNIIIDGIMQSPDIIKIQLCICFKNILKFDPPIFWLHILDKICIYVQSPDINVCSGALLSLYQLMKNYNILVEKNDPLFEAQRIILPTMYNLINNFQQDQSYQSVRLQKHILKCFYSVIKYQLPFDLFARHEFIEWMEVFCKVLIQPMPEHTLQVDVDKRLELPWWKIKKWAAHILYRLFKKYGSPSNIHKENQFAHWFLTMFSSGILEVLLNLLDQYRKGVYISPRVLQWSLNYIDHAINYAQTWKLLKPHMFAIIRDVLFPLMSYSETDEKLWNDDPHEYIKIKFDVIRDLKSPVTSAQILLISVCEKRKGILQRTIQLCLQVLTCQNNEFQPNQREGALHMVGTLSNILMNKKVYKDEIETFLKQLVFPEIHSPFGYMRARGCWLLHCFSSIHFKNERFLLEAVHLTINSILTDTELPVRVEASIALKVLLRSQIKVHQFLRPQVIEVTLELLKVIRETENEDIAHVLQKFLSIFPEQLTPMASQIIDHLANTFIKMIIESKEDRKQKAMTATSLMATIESVLNVVEDNLEIMSHLEKLVLDLVKLILQHNITEHYEDAMTLLCYFTAKTISEDVWKMFELIYQVFEKDGFDYFIDMMPVLYHYVTVDTTAFLSNESHVLAIYNMMKTILSADVETESEIYAAKLLEVIVLQCSGKIDNCIYPLVELIISRLLTRAASCRLRTMLLQVLICVLYCNPQLLFSTLERLQESIPNVSLTRYLINQWIHDTKSFMGRHNQKLCLLGICTLLEVGIQRINLGELETIPKLLPSCLSLFNGMKRTCEGYTDNETNFEENKKEYEKDDDKKVLSSDEDNTTNVQCEYTKTLFRIFNKTDTGQNLTDTAKMDIYSDEESNFSEEPDAMCFNGPLEAKINSVDVYITFKETLAALSSKEPGLFQSLTRALTEDQNKQMNEIFMLADQRKARQGNN